tara:strand:- start:55 stop:228 length:174 start_codon:yes stop_codon:yes gene_type:complete
VEYGYRAAYGTFRELEKLEEFSKEYIENNRIAVRFECRTVEIKPEIIPLPKPQGKAT